MGEQTKCTNQWKNEGTSKASENNERMRKQTKRTNKQRNRLTNKAQTNGAMGKLSVWTIRRTDEQIKQVNQRANIQNICLDKQMNKWIN